MKLSRVALLSLGGMMLTSLAVYGLTDPVALAAPASDGVGKAVASLASTERLAPGGFARFVSAGTLALEARLGHARMQAGPQQSFVTLEIRGTDTQPTKRPPLHMALVVDKSGSMKGTRIENAIRAAQGVVDRLADGDTVTVVSFDTSTELVVSPTVLDAQSRGRIHQAVSGIRLGGDTCISCGVEHAMSELRRVSRGNELQRVIVLSDGAANNGVRDVPGFQQLARTCRDMGIAVSTVGVGIDYNERVLSTLALESNGLHHFAESDSELQAVFEAETRTAISTVASNAEARIAVMPGVSLRRVFGRAFRREGDKIIVPLGTFSPGEVKTVLMEVDIHGNDFGTHNVADVILSYTDLVKDGAVTAHGALATTIADSTDALDPFVSARLQQAHTTASLNVASDLAKVGDFDGARRALERRRDELRVSAAKPRAKVDARGADIDRNLKQQVEFAEEAIDDLAQPAAPAETQRAVRKNQTRIFANEL